jgi:hypothetical protein
LAAAERADLLAQIVSAQAELDLVLAQLGNDVGSTVAEAQAQRQLLAQLERSLASGIALPAASARGEIAGVLAGVTQLSQQARAASEHRMSFDLATAQAQTRATVLDISRDIYERRLFDPYLRFHSPEQEAAYRKREASNRRAIEEALALNTPEGDLRAAHIMDRQLQDAGAHGADASPQFKSLMDRNRENMGRLEAALGERRPTRGDDRSATSFDHPAAATSEQLASVLAAFRAAGIGGGVSAHESGHGLSVEVGPPDKGRTV